MGGNVLPALYNWMWRWRWRWGFSNCDRRAGYQPVTETSPDATVFGGVVVKNSAERQFKITSTGTRTLHVVLLFHQLIRNFSIPDSYDNCSGKALAVGASCTFIVRYEPTSQESGSWNHFHPRVMFRRLIALIGFQGYAAQRLDQSNVSAACAGEVGS